MIQGAFNYKLKVEDELLAGVSLRIESLANLNETIDELFEKLAREGDPALLESLCPYFGVVWPSARGLSEIVVEEWRASPSSLEGRTVLEVGCGLAVPSFVAARLGAKVTATDFHPDIPRFLERNAALNGVEGLEFVSRDWQASKEPLGAYDWVIGSDILYEKQHPAPVAAMLAAHCAPGGRIVLADPGRPYLQAFADEMRRLGFSCDTAIRTVRDTPVAKDVFVLVMKR